MKKYIDLLTEGTDISLAEMSVCKYCSQEFPIFDLEKKILDTHGFSHSWSCPLCTFKIHNSYFNDRHLYHRKDSFSGEKIISTHQEDSPMQIMEVKRYRKMMAEDHGLKFARNPSEDIFHDFRELYQEFPQSSRLVYPGIENAEYASHIWRAKNLYLSYCVFVDCEDIYYSFRIIWKCKDVFSSYDAVESCSNIYQSSTVGKSYDIFFSSNIVSSRQMLFCRDMNNSQECIFCCNQVNASYKVFNKQYSKEEYKNIKEDIYERIQDERQLNFLEKKYQNFLEENYIEQSLNMNNCEKVVWEITFDSKNSIHTFMSTAVENCVNIMNAGDDGKDKNIYVINSVEFGTNCENVIGSSSFGMNIYNTFFSFKVANSCKNIYYSTDIESSEECMFCIGLRNKKFCILNKQYEKKQYFLLKEKIIEDLKGQWKWGDDLGWSFSPFPYNDTLAYDYFWVEKVIYADGREEVIDKDSEGIVTIFSDDFISEAELDLGGDKKIPIIWRTKTKEINIPEKHQLVDYADITNIQDISEDILKKVMLCKETGRPFRVIREELEFLKNKNLPLSFLHPEVRLEKLLWRRNLGRMYIWKSDLSGKDILSVYKTPPKWRVYGSDEYIDFMYK